MSSEGSGTAGTATIGMPAKRLLALALPVLLWACSTLLPSAVFAQATCGPPFFSCPTDQQCVVFEGECRHNPGLAGEICGLADPCASNLQCTGGRCAARRQAGQSCTGFGQGSCQSGLLCDARGVCRNDPPRLGQPCGAGVACTDVGTSSCISIGLGASPADIGLFNCTTEVLEADLDSNGDGMIDVDVVGLNLDPTAPVATPIATACPTSRRSARSSARRTSTAMASSTRSRAVRPRPTRRWRRTFRSAAVAR